MGSSKINNRGEVKFTGVLVTLVLVFAIIIGTYPLISDALSQGNYTASSEYLESYGRINESANTAYLDAKAMQNATQNMADADNTFQAIWNGMKGLVAGVQTVLNFIPLSINTFAAFTGLGVLPSWVIALVTTLIVGVLALAALGALKGESKT